MKIIQSYNSFSFKGIPHPARMSCGFATLEDLVNYLKKSYEVHKRFDYLFYTDEFGLSLVEDFMLPEHIEVVQFERYDNRNPYSGKFYIHSLQREPYIHVDNDATLFEVPSTDSDIVTEKMRRCTFKTETSTMELNMRGIRQIICSGLLGFNDMKLKDIYVQVAIEKCMWAKRNVKALDFPSMVANEEYTLTLLARKYNNSIYEINGNCKYEHLQGKVK